jgi:F0F1-type ATP synthase membrane subunit b/b'
MAEADRNAQFQKISRKVEVVRENTRDELAGEVANAKDKASEAAGHLENRAETALDEASEQLHEIRGKRVTR